MCVDMHRPLYSNMTKNEITISWNNKVSELGIVKSANKSEYWNSQYDTNRIKAENTEKIVILNCKTDMLSWNR